MKLSAIHKELRRMDPNLEPDSESFKAAVVLLSALQVGPDDTKVAEFTGYSPSLCEEFGYRLRKAGVWKDGKTHCEWFDEDNGGIAFWMDVAVAQGLLQRAKATKKIKSQKIGAR